MDDENREREAAKALFSAQPKPEDAEIVRADPAGPEIVFVCPFCDDSYQVSSDLAGKTIKCRNCHELCRVDKRKEKKRKVGPLGFSPRSFWLGVAVGGVLTALAAALLKVVHVL